MESGEAKRELARASLLEEDLAIMEETRGKEFNKYFVMSYFAFIHVWSVFKQDHDGYLTNMAASKESL